MTAKLQNTTLIYKDNQFPLNHEQLEFEINTISFTLAPKYGQLIFDKGASLIQWRDNSLFKQIVLEHFIMLM